MSVLSNFNFTNAELAQRADKTLLAYRRDMQEFEGYGFKEENGAIIDTKTAAFKALPSDDFYEGEQKMQTNFKNVIREALENQISDLRNRCKLVFGAKSVEFSLFKFGRTHNLNDTELVAHALHVVETGKPRLGKLAERMVNQAMFDGILASRTELDDAIDMQARAVSIRKEKVVERHRLGNELYKLIGELCDVGKMIWKGKNEAYYTDYVIYGSAKPMADQAEELEEEMS